MGKKVFFNPITRVIIKIFITILAIECLITYYINVYMLTATESLIKFSI